MSVRNLSYIRTIPVFGPRLYETLSDILTQQSNAAMQTNANPSGGSQAPPPQINALTVTAGAGIAHVQITDNNQMYRGVKYHVQYATEPGFSNPITAHMGPSRDLRIPVGTQPLYYRAFSDYPTSDTSNPVYHGGSTPIAVTASGTDQPPIPTGKGSGTGTPGQISGHGPIPFRGSAPPKRS